MAERKLLNRRRTIASSKPFLPSRATLSQSMKTTINDASDNTSTAHKRHHSQYKKKSTNSIAALNKGGAQSGSILGSLGQGGGSSSFDPFSRRSNGLGGDYDGDLIMMHNCNYDLDDDDEKMINHFRNSKMACGRRNAKIPGSIMRSRKSQQKTVENKPVTSDDSSECFLGNNKKIEILSGDDRNLGEQAIINPTFRQQQDFSDNLLLNSTKNGSSCIKNRSRTKQSSCNGFFADSETTILRRIPFSEKMMTDKQLTINVSGTHFKVWASVFDRFPDSLLGNAEIREQFYDYEKKFYFIDRDPVLFRHVLNYYRSGKLHYPKTDCVCAVEDELSYYGISHDIITDCCYEDYRDKKHEVVERLDDSNIDRTNLKRLSRNPQFSVKQKIWMAVEHPGSCTFGLVFYYITGFFIASSVCANIIETVHIGGYEGDRGGIMGSDARETYGHKYRDLFLKIDICSIFVFTLEYVLRLYAAPDRIRYMTSIMALIDLVAILPSILAYIVKFYMETLRSERFTPAFSMLRVFRVFRVFKFSRHSQGLRILGYTLKSCASELGFLLFSIGMAVIIFATFIYYCEKDEPHTKFTSIPISFWYTIVTMTTLGYGSMVPKTPLGMIIGSFCSLSGVLTIALPVPVIVSSFSRIYQQNQRSDKRQLQKRARIERIRQARNEKVTNNWFSYESPNKLVEESNEVFY